MRISGSACFAWTLGAPILHVMLCRTFHCVCENNTHIKDKEKKKEEGVRMGGQLKKKPRKHRKAAEPHIKAPQAKTR